MGPLKLRQAELDSLKDAVSSGKDARALYFAHCGQLLVEKVNCMTKNRQSFQDMLVYLDTAAHAHASGRAAFHQTKVCQPFAFDPGTGSRASLIRSTGY